MYVTGLTDAHLVFYRPGFTGIEGITGWMRILHVPYNRALMEDRVIPQLKLFHEIYMTEPFDSGMPSPDWIDPDVKRGISDVIKEAIRYDVVAVNPVSFDPVIIAPHDE